MQNEEVQLKKNYETLEFWRAQISSAKLHLEKYHAMGNEIVDIYRDEGRDSRLNTESNYAIVYSNTETILPVLFSETPEADVKAQDTKSMAARGAASMLEDMLNYSAKMPETIDAIECAVKDLLLPGMGLVRVCYYPYFDEDEKGEEILISEKIDYKYIDWRDLLFPECRKWGDLPWIAFRGLYNRESAEEEFGSEVAAKLEYTYRDESAPKQNTDSDAFGQAEVWEVWCKCERKVVWFSDSKFLDTPIRIDDDPLELDGFYPVPKPLFSCTTNNTILPVPLYVEYQDLACELNEVSSRIRAVVANLKRRGVYDAQFPELQDMVNGGDNEFFPIKNFVGLQDKGGLQAVMDKEDISSSVAVLASLYEQRRQIIQSIYEVMGYADILRGVSDPRETASAQRIKGRFGTLRISRMQRDVQRFIRDSLRIAGEIIANKFDPRSIALVTGVELSQVVRYQEILQQIEPSSVIVDVQTDSTVAADDIADKEEMIEFMNAFMAFIQGSSLMAQTIGIKATGELLLTMLKRFKLGRNVEQPIIDRIEQMLQAEAAAAERPKEPTAEEKLVMVEQQKVQQKAAKDAGDFMIKQAELQLKEREIMIEEAKLGFSQKNEEARLNFEGIELVTKQLATMAEASTSGNDFVGV